MREELIRVENGCFRREDEFYRFEISISRGECIGVYVDDHFTSGTAYLDLFKGGTHLERGRAFSCGRRVGPLELERWILQNARIVNWHRFHSQELTVRDFLLALDRSGRLAAEMGRGPAPAQSGEPGDPAADGTACAAGEPACRPLPA